MDLKRKAMDLLHEWKERSQGRSAMLIEGARRVGKSYLARKFAAAEYRSFIYIDLGEMGDELREIFADTSDLTLFFMKLEAYSGETLYKRESLIVFDEVQLFPKARQLIKYLVADGRYDYLETGSLLSIRQNVENILIPSEEEAIRLNPLDFEEFLWALKQEPLAAFIRTCFEKMTPLGAALHRKAMNYLRLYMMTGGMPQAVNAYLEEQALTGAQAVKSQILRLYRNDISKFARGYEARTRAVFDLIPSELSRHEKRFKLSHLSSSARSRDYEDAFMWLADGGIALLCMNSTDPSLGLNLNLERQTLKCYAADTGLLISQAIADGTLLEENVLKAVMIGDVGINEGMLAENLVAQMLNASGHRLFFYSKGKGSDGADKPLEIDFLIRRDRRICPVEVKSSARLTHASLDEFRRHFREHLGQAYLICRKDLEYRAKEDLLILPFYMTFCL